MKALRILAFLAALTPGLTPAFSQQFPTVPDRSVIGRIGTGTGSGPSQAIPFLNLQTAMGIPTLPSVYASTYGMKCDGVTDDAAALQTAVNIAASVANGSGVEVILPSGTCPIGTAIYRNTYTTGGVLTVPGMKIRGQGRGVTKLDTRVANDFLIAANPAWRGGHQAAFNATTSTTGGSLATNTYYLKITENDGLGHEIVVTLAKSFSVTGPTGSISIPLPALNPGYSYNLYCDTASTPAHYCSVSGQNATAKAGNQTVVVTAIGSAATVPTALSAIWQEVSISDLSITNSTNAANASGISFFKVGYSDLTNVYMGNLTGDGFGMQAYTGDIDGSFNVGIHNSKFDTIAGTCINAAGNVLETSNFTVDNLTALNVCGTAPTNVGTAVTISSIPNSASPLVTTSTAHNLKAGDQIAFTISGMTLSSYGYRVGQTVTGTTFNLVDLNGVAVNTTSLGSFTSGTVALSWRPPQLAGGVITGGGGCVAWTGLISTFRNLGFTQCNNFGIYVTEAGTNDNLTIENVDFENTAGKGLYIASLNGGTLKNFECLGAAAFGKTVSCVQIGSGMPSGGVSNFLADVGKVRIDSATNPSTAFEQFPNTNIAATYQDTNFVRNITWQTFDGTGQARFNGFVFPPVPGTVQFSISAANTAKLIPVGLGGCLPIHLKSPGEWVCYHVPSAGVTGAITGGLSATTPYNCYAWNSASNLFPYSLSFECLATGTAFNEGYQVKSTETFKTFIGTATTDGSGNFQTTGAQSSWYPLGNTVFVSGALPITSGGLGCSTYSTFSNAAYTILATDCQATQTGSLSANRNVNLPAASSFASGRRLIVVDFSGTATTANTISLAPSGADQINGSNTTQVAVNAGYGFVEVESDGVSKWTAMRVSLGSPLTVAGLTAVVNGGTGLATITANGVMIGQGTSNVSTVNGTGGNSSLPLISQGAVSPPIYTTLGPTGGGTGASSLTANAFLTGAGAGTINQVAITGLVLGNGASAPTAYTGATCTNQFIRILSAAGVPTCASVALGSDVTGTLLAAQEPAHTGDVTNSAGSLAMTLAAGNAGNLNSGTLLAARMPALTGDCTTSAGAVATTCTKINGVDQTTAWTTYTPTITSGSGAFTTVSATGRYKQIGKTIHLQVDIVITAAGTAASSLIATLPINSLASTAYSGVGRERAATGASCIGYITTSDASHVNVIPMAGGTIIATGNSVTISITYEAA